LQQVNFSGLLTRKNSERVALDPVFVKTCLMMDEVALYNFISH